MGVPHTQVALEHVLVVPEQLRSQPVSESWGGRSLCSATRAMTTCHDHTCAPQLQVVPGGDPVLLSLLTPLHPRHPAVMSLLIACPQDTPRQ